jgi:hypothetical protein
MKFIPVKTQYAYQAAEQVALTSNLIPLGAINKHNHIVTHSKPLRGKLPKSLTKIT